MVRMKTFDRLLEDRALLIFSRPTDRLLTCTTYLSVHGGTDEDLGPFAGGGLSHAGLF